MPEVSPKRTGKWWVKGGTGWVGFIEEMNADGVDFDEETVSRLREVRDRLNKIVSEQEQRSENHASSISQ